MAVILGQETAVRLGKETAAVGSSRVAKGLAVSAKDAVDKSSSTNKTVSSLNIDQDSFDFVSQPHRRNMVECHYLVPRNHKQNSTDCAMPTHPGFETVEQP